MASTTERPVTVANLREAELAYRASLEPAKVALLRRNRVVRQALAEGWTHARIAEATGLTRGRIGQIALSA